MPTNPLTIGSEIRVNTTTALDQKAPSVTGLADGGWVVTWQSLNQDGSGYGIYQQRFDKTGTPVSAADILVNITTGSDQTEPSVTALADGGWLVTWTSQNQDVGWNGGIYQQRFDKNGNALFPTDKLVNASTSFDQSLPSVTGLANGGWVITWVTEGQDGSGPGIYQQHYNSSGVPIGGETRVNVLTDGSQTRPAVTALTDGGWVVTWESHSAGPTGHTIYQQRYDANGTASAVTDLPVEATGGDYKILSSVTGLSDGGWVATWTSYNGGDIIQQRFDKNGIALFSTPQRVNAVTGGLQEPASVTALKDGGWVVVWQSANQDGSGNGIYLQAYDKHGNPIGTADLLVNTVTAGHQELPSVSALSDGWIVTWQSAGQDGDGYGIYQKRYFTDAPPTDLSLSSTLVNEDHVGRIGFLTGTDPNTSDTFTFTLAEDLSGKFTIIGNELWLKPGQSLDYETVQSHVLKITVTDQTGLSITKTVTLNVHDVNDKPDVTITGTGPSGTLAIDENAEAGTLVAALSGFDPEGDAISFSLIDNGGLFTLVGSEIRVADNAVLDYEGSGGTERTIKILVIDAKGAAQIKTVVIHVTDRNDAPSAIVLSETKIAENAFDGTVVGTLSAADQDPNDSFIYTLIVDAGGRFALSEDGKSIVVADSSKLDFEASSSYTIKVMAIDQAGASVTQDIVITLADVNEKPSALMLSNDHIDENNSDGAIIGLLAGTDGDAGDVLSYTILEDPDAVFDMSGHTLKLRSGVTLNADSKSFHDVTVRVQDKGGLFYDRTFTIHVNDVNEKPADITLSGLSVGENAVNGTLVGTLSATDPDTVGSHVFTLVDSAGGRFRISDDNTRIVVADGSLLDYESASVHKIQIRVTDQGGLSYDKSFDIHIGNAYETPTNHSPVDITLTGGAKGNASVDENTFENIKVGELGALDFDPDDSFTFMLIENAGGRFKLSADGKSILIADASLIDYEVASFHVIKVDVSDGKGGTFTKTFEIAVNDVNEKPSDIVLSATELKEGAADNTFVGTLAVLDQDTKGHYIYELLEDAGGRFKLSADGKSILVSDGSLLDYETSSFHDIQVRVTDGTHIVEKVIRILLQDAVEQPSNHAPFDITLTGGAKGDASVDENSSINVAVGNLGALDLDSDFFTYELLEDAGGRFKLSADGLSILVADGSLINREIASSHTVKVRVSDGKGGTFTKVIAIAVNDVDEAPSDITLSGTMVNENSAANIFIGTLGVLDEDAIGLYTYELIDDAGGRFKLSADGKSLLVANGDLLDFEAASLHTVKVRVVNGKHVLEKAIEIALNDVSESISNPTNHAPYDIALTGGANGDASVNENAAAGAVVGILAALDLDAGDSFTYTLLSNAGGRFKLSSDGRFILVADGSLIDYEAASSHTIKVQVSDGKGGTFMRELIVAVNDVNEAPTSIVLSGNPIVEGAADGVFVGTLDADDQDKDRHYTYELLDSAGGRFRLSADGRSILVANGSLLDYETASSHDIKVRLTDGSHVIERVMTVHLNDVAEPPVNDAPTDIILSVSSIAENAVNGAVIGTLTATDQNMNETFTFSLTDDADGRFEVFGNKLRVKDGSRLDFESASFYTIKVHVIDKGNLSYEKELKITLEDVDETTVNQKPVITVAEGKQVTDAIDDGANVSPFKGVTFADAENDTLTVKISFDASHGDLVIPPDLFIEGMAGVVKNGIKTYTFSGTVDMLAVVMRMVQFNPADRPEAVSGSVLETVFSIQVSDTAHPSNVVTNNTVAVRSTASNRAPNDLTLSNKTLRELLSSGDVKIGDFLPEDSNAGDVFTYQIQKADGTWGTSNGLFTVSGSELHGNGFLFDYEQARSHVIKIKVTDAHGGSFTQNLTIDVIDWAAENTTGSAGDDKFIGGFGRDVLGGSLGQDHLDGGYGNDILTGGLGRDVFLFKNKLGKTGNLDTISDFSIRDDRIWLDNAVFKKLGSGSPTAPKMLSKTFFTIGTKAKDKKDYLIYDNKKGYLSYDADGSGKGAAIVFAKLAKKLDLTGKHFFVI